MRLDEEPLAVDRLEAYRKSLRSSGLTVLQFVAFLAAFGVLVLSLGALIEGWGLVAAAAIALVFAAVDLRTASVMVPIQFYTNRVVLPDMGWIVDPKHPKPSMTRLLVGMMRRGRGGRHVILGDDIESAGIARFSDSNRRSLLLLKTKDGRGFLIPVSDGMEPSLEKALETVRPAGAAKADQVDPTPGTPS